MLSQSYCAVLSEAERPRVSWTALLQLRHLLDEAGCGAATVSVERHLSFDGGADVQDETCVAADSADVVRSTAREAELGEPAHARAVGSGVPVGEDVAGAAVSSGSVETRRAAR